MQRQGIQQIHLETAQPGKMKFFDNKLFCIQIISFYQMLSEILAVG